MINKKVGTQWHAIEGNFIGIGKTRHEALMNLIDIISEAYLELQLKLANIENENETEN